MEFSVIFEAQLANPSREREHQVLRDEVCLEAIRHWGETIIPHVRREFG